MEDEKQLYTIIIRHDTSLNWAINDPILANGEYGVEDDTHKVKRGNGNNKWSELLYEDFGLQFIVTMENLTGNISDNATLNNAFADVENKINTINNEIEMLSKNKTVLYANNLMLRASDLVYKLNGDGTSTLSIALKDDVTTGDFNEDCASGLLSVIKI